MKKSTKLFFALVMMLGFGAFAQQANFTWTPTSPCVGQTVQLTSTSTGTSGNPIYGYSLTGATTASIQGPNAVVTFTGSGVQTVTLVILVNFAPVSFTVKPITVLAAPTISAISSQSNAVCPGTTATLTAAGTSTGYVWSSPLTSSLATASITVPAQNTTYTVTGTGANGCTSTATVMQQVTANPITLSTTATGNTLCANSSATLTASGGTSYAWSAPLTSTEATAVITPSMVGTNVYTVNATSATCPGYTWTAMITQTVVSCTGVNEVAASKIVAGLYPNPAATEVSIEFNNDAVKNIQVIDLTGRAVLTTAGSDKKVTMNVSGLAKGIYYVKIQSENKVEVSKFVKE